MVVVMIMMVSARLTRAFLLSVIALHLYPFSAWNTLSRLQLDRFLPAISEQAGVGLCLEFVGFIQWRSHTINRGWSNIPLLTEIPFVSGITLLFTEPPDARKPNVRWRLYVFKAGEVLNEPLYVHRQSCYLFGRERRVADIPTDHPSCSKQHAVIQFRLVEKEQPDGMMSKQPRICYLTRELDRLKGASLTSAFLRLLCCVWWHAWNWWNLRLCRLRCHFRQVRLADGIQLSHTFPEFQVVTGAGISLVICIFVHCSYRKILCFAEEWYFLCIT